MAHKDKLREYYANAQYWWDIAEFFREKKKRGARYARKMSNEYAKKYLCETTKQIDKAFMRRRGTGQALARQELCGIIGRNDPSPKGGGKERKVKVGTAKDVRSVLLPPN